MKIILNLTLKGMNHTDQHASINAPSDVGAAENAAAAA